MHDPLAGVPGEEQRQVGGVEGLAAAAGGRGDREDRAWVGTAGAAGSGTTPGWAFGTAPARRRLPMSRARSQGDHEVVVVEREAEEVVGPGLDDLPEAGVGPVG